MEGWNNGMVENGILEEWKSGIMEWWNTGILGGRSIYFGTYLPNHPGSAFSGAIQSV